MRLFCLEIFRLQTKSQRCICIGWWMGNSRTNLIETRQPPGTSCWAHGQRSPENKITNNKICKNVREAFFTLGGWAGPVFKNIHTDRFRNNSVTIEFDEVLSCLSCYKLQLGKLISSLQTIQIPVQKSWICRRFIYENTSSKSM